MKVKEIPVNERPREKLESYGPSNLSTSDLLSIILASGLKGKNVTELSFELLSKTSFVALFKKSNTSSFLMDSPFF